MDSVRYAAQRDALSGAAEWRESVEGDDAMQAYEEQLRVAAELGWTLRSQVLQEYGYHNLPYPYPVL